MKLRDVFQAHNRIKPFIRKTPLEYSWMLSNLSRKQVFLKLENYQLTNSFKVRGVFNKLLKRRKELANREIITASAGNHGLAIAYASHMLGIKAKIVIPEKAPDIIIERIRQLNSNLILHGKTYDEAETYAKMLAEKEKLVYISPYNDLDVIEGHATIGLEILLDNPDIDTILVPVGGGGLISGVAFVSKTIDSDIKIIGVQTEASPSMYYSIKKGRIVDVELKPSIVGGLHGNIEKNSITFDFVKKYVDEIVLVSEDEIKSAVSFSIQKLGMMIEGSAAVTIAALLKYPVKLGEKICLIISGGNLDTEILSNIIRNE